MGAIEPSPLSALATHTAHIGLMVGKGSSSLLKTSIRGLLPTQRGRGHGRVPGRGTGHEACRFSLYSWDPTLGSRHPKSRGCVVGTATCPAPKMGTCKEELARGVPGKKRKTRKQARKGEARQQEDASPGCLGKGGCTAFCETG